VFHVKHSPELIANVSRETLGRLELYGEILKTWNRTINLISKADEVRIWERHVLDGLQLLPLIPAGITHAIDLGSGGGIPGLVLAIASGVHFTLIEADHRKSAFLREAARLCNAPVDVVSERIERVRLAPVDLITVRAVAPLSELLAMSKPLLRPTGALLALKGRNGEAELTVAREEWHMAAQRIPSVTDPAAVIFKITEVHRVRRHE